MSMSEKYMTELLEARMNDIDSLSFNKTEMIEEEKAEHIEDIGRLRQQLYEATAMEDKKDEMLEDRVINLLRGHTLSLQSHTRIRNTLNQCLVANDLKSEYPSKELVDKYIKKFYNHFGMVEPKETEMDFIKEREMEIF
jgi:hypothetical protein